jgi:hypothetical protein
MAGRLLRRFLALVICGPSTSHPPLLYIIYTPAAEIGFILNLRPPMID